MTSLLLLTVLGAAPEPPDYREPPDAIVSAPTVPPPTTTYLTPDGRLLVVPAGQSLPANWWQPVPQTMPSTCPNGQCPQAQPARRGWFR